MGHDLRVQPFSSALLADVQGFDCGGDPWQVEVATWIKDTSTDECAVKWIERGTEVWLYRTADGSLVGYGGSGADGMELAASQWSERVGQYNSVFWRPKGLSR